MTDVKEEPSYMREPSQFDQAILDALQASKCGVITLLAVDVFLGALASAGLEISQGWQGIETCSVEPWKYVLASDGKSVAKSYHTKSGNDGAITWTNCELRGGAGAIWKPTVWMFNPSPPKESDRLEEIAKGD